MKKLLLLSLAFCLAAPLSFCQSKQAADQGITFETGTLAETLTKAKKENKLVFVDVYTTWCGPCKRMASEVFTQKNVGDYFNATFVNAKFDAEQGEGIQMASKYGVDAYPTFLILDADGNLKAKMIGGSPPDAFITRIKQQLQQLQESK